MTCRTCYRLLFYEEAKAGSGQCTACVQKFMQRAMQLRDLGFVVLPLVVKGAKAYSVRKAVQ